MIQYVELGAVADVNWGDTSTTKSSYIEEGFTAYSATGPDGFLPYADHDRDAVILSAIGARCGKVWFAEGKWSCIKNTIRYWSTSPKLDNRYLYWVTNDEDFFPKRGAAQPFITIGDARKVRIPLPPLDEQKRIAAILDKADQLHQKRRQAITLLDSLTQSIFLEMFGSGNEKWPIVELSEAVKKGTIVTYGIVQAGEEYDGGVPYIRTGDIKDGEIVRAGLRHTDPALAAKFRRSRVEANEIVMSIRATVGTCALVPTELDGANLTQGTARIAPGEHCTPEYLLYYIRSTPVQQWIQKQVKGATFREITLAKLRELKVILAPLQLQEDFSRAIHGINRQVSHSKFSLQSLENLFSSLQHRAFSGQL